MGIENYIANLSMSQSYMKVQTSVQTSILKKAMDGNEEMVNNLIEEMKPVVELPPNFEGSINKLI